MKNRTMITILTILAVLMLSVCSNADYQKIEVTLTIPAPSLKDNLVEEPTEQKIYIKLPPKYYSSKKRYPVLYYLHGFGGTQDEISNFLGMADQQTLDNTAFIIVGVNGKNQLGGSFWVNSPVTGNWEDFLVKDVVGYIDGKYRTIAKASSRGIAGFSMGGFSAINIALKHPETFSCLYAACPGLFEKKSGLQKALKDWKYDDKVKNSYGAAFAPDIKAPFPHAQLPKYDNSENDKKIFEIWEKGYGDLENKVKNYLSKPEKLSAILIEYGKSDEFKWIPEGCKYFSKVLKDNKVQHELAPFDGTHEVVNRIDVLLNFFSKNLKMD